MTIDETVTSWDNKWHQVTVPLSDLQEKGLGIMHGSTLRINSTGQRLIVLKLLQSRTR